jgi:hypothetical protein
MIWTDAIEKSINGIAFRWDVLKSGEKVHIYVKKNPKTKSGVTVSVKKNRKPVKLSGGSMFRNLDRFSDWKVLRYA